MPSTIVVAAVIVLLIVVDVVLVTLAADRTEPADNGSVGPLPTFSSTPFRTTSDTPSPTASAEASGVGRRMLVVEDPIHAWRASSGSCGGESGVVQRTSDGGASWTDVTLDVGGPVFGIAGASGGRLAVMVGSGASCDPQVRVSDADGTLWAEGRLTDVGSAIEPAGIRLDGVAEDAPCARASDAYQGQFTTLVACGEDGLRWRNGSSAWAAVRVPGALAVADDGDSYLVARSDVPGCEGVRIDSMQAVGVTAGTRTVGLGCVTGTSDGPVALGRSGDTVWLWGGHDVRVSKDGGATW